MLLVPELTHAESWLEFPAALTSGSLFLTAKALQGIPGCSTCIFLAQRAEEGQMCTTSSLGWFSAGLAQHLHSQQLAQGEDEQNCKSSVTTEQALGHFGLLFCAPQPMVSAGGCTWTLVSC